MGVYVVTGGSGGIGGKTVEILREQGHEVINVDLKDSDISANLATKEGRDEVIQKIHELHPEGIDMFFRNRFLFKRFQITDPLIISDTQAYYYAVYNGYHIRAVATIQDFSEDGEIQRLVVRPA